MIYNSPVIHTVAIGPLQAGHTYGYRVAGSSRNYSFTMPPEPGAADAFPLTLGLTADLGQTIASRANMEVLRRQAETFGVSAVLLAGDLSYADGYYSRWDTYGRMMEPLASTVPVMTTGGNHELSTAEAWVSYNARYPMPHRASGSHSNLWWSRPIGPVFVIALCSYAATDAMSLQQRWLRRTIATIDRAATPWVVAMMHAPWYNSNVGHVGEAELMRRDMEGLLYEARVDVVLSGHVHAYERMHAVYNGCVDPCGPVYLNLGDGGNREGAYIPWLEPQPSWSAFRQSTFGTGLLTVHNASHAWYNWTRAACVSLNETTDFVSLDGAGCATEDRDRGADNSEHPQQPSDGVWIVRDAARDAACAPVQCAPDPAPIGERKEEESKLPEWVVGENGHAPHEPEVELDDEADDEVPTPPRETCLGASAVSGLVAGVAIGVFVGGVLTGAAIATLRVRSRKHQKRRTRGVEIITGPLHETTETGGRGTCSPGNPSASASANGHASAAPAQGGDAARGSTNSGSVGGRANRSEVV